MKKSEYQKIVDRVLLPKLLKLGFREVVLKDCMRSEVLLRKDDLWLGTSWDYRDGYLNLDLGPLYWFADVMPRVVVVGEYSSHCSIIKRIKVSDPNYLELIAKTVAETIEDAILSYNEHPEATDHQLARLRPYLLGKVNDERLTLRRLGIAAPEHKQTPLGLINSARVVIALGPDSLARDIAEQRHRLAHFGDG